MDDAIHKAIADLSALIKDADSEDAKRIRRIIRRLQKFDADAELWRKLGDEVVRRSSVMSAR